MNYAAVRITAGGAAETSPKFAFVTQGKGTDNPRHWALYPFEYDYYRTVVLKVTWGD